MKKILPAVLALSILSGCAGITLPSVSVQPLTPISPTTPGQGIINNAISLSGTFCGIGPTVASIVNMFVANPLLVSAEDVARAFCAAIAPKAMSASKRGAVRPGTVLMGSYRGHPISGTIR